MDFDLTELFVSNDDAASQPPALALSESQAPAAGYLTVQELFGTTGTTGLAGLAGLSGLSGTTGTTNTLRVCTLSNNTSCGLSSTLSETSAECNALNATDTSRWNHCSLVDHSDSSIETTVAASTTSMPDLIQFGDFTPLIPSVHDSTMTGIHDDYNSLMNNKMPSQSDFGLFQHPRRNSTLASIPSISIAQPTSTAIHSNLRSDRPSTIVISTTPVTKTIPESGALMSAWISPSAGLSNCSFNSFAVPHPLSDSRSTLHQHLLRQQSMTPQNDLYSNSSLSASHLKHNSQQLLMMHPQQSFQFQPLFGLSSGSTCVSSPIVSSSSTLTGTPLSVSDLAVSPIGSVSPRIVEPHALMHAPTHTTLASVSAPVSTTVSPSTMMMDSKYPLLGAESDYSEEDHTSDVFRQRRLGSDLFIGHSDVPTTFTALQSHSNHDVSTTVSIPVSAQYRRHSSASLTVMPIATVKINPIDNEVQSTAVISTMTSTTDATTTDVDSDSESDLEQVSDPLHDALITAKTEDSKHDHHDPYHSTYTLNASMDNASTLTKSTNKMAPRFASGGGRGRRNKRASVASSTPLALLTPLRNGLKPSSGRRRSTGAATAFMAAVTSELLDEDPNSHPAWDQLSKEDLKLFIDPSLSMQDRKLIRQSITIRNRRRNSIAALDSHDRMLPLLPEINPKSTNGFSPLSTALTCDNGSSFDVDSLNSNGTGVSRRRASVSTLPLSNSKPFATHTTTTYSPKSPAFLHTPSTPSGTPAYIGSTLDEFTTLSGSSSPKSTTALNTQPRRVSFRENVRQRRESLQALLRHISTQEGITYTVGTPFPLRSLRSATTTLPMTKVEGNIESKGTGDNLDNMDVSVDESVQDSTILSSSDPMDMCMNETDIYSHQKQTGSPSHDISHPPTIVNTVAAVESIPDDLSRLVGTAFILKVHSVDTPLLHHHQPSLAGSKPALCDEHPNSCRIFTPFDQYPSQGIMFEDGNVTNAIHHHAKNAQRLYLQAIGRFSAMDDCIPPVCSVTTEEQIMARDLLQVMLNL
ncbi:hypothetical protein RTP6_007505 [Batrachochytrium dendrobatidis]